MIVRLVTATVKAERAGTFNALMRAQLPALRRSPGLVYVKLARRIRGDSEEVLLYEEWHDTESLYGWAGPEITRARLDPAAAELVTSLTIVHYEALDIDPDSAWYSQMHGQIDEKGLTVEEDTVETEELRETVEQEHSQMREG
jgi:heme-degrading monooxygenase HmoA